MSPWLDDVPSLALFARVVHHRSFSAAAREAGLAKSAVSRRIAQLEGSLGVRLLQRTTRSLTPTEEGLRIYEHAAALVAAATSALEVGRGAGHAVRGTLRVNAPVTFAQLHLARILALFAKRHSEVTVQLSTDDRFVDVVEGGFDVVIRIGRLQDSTLVARKLASDRLVICASPEYLAEHGEPLHPAELVGHQCLHYALVSRDAEWRFRGARQQPLSIPTRGSFVSSDGTTLREAAKAGLGLVTLPSFMVARDVASGELRLVLEGARRAQIGIYAVTAHRTHAPPRVKAFLTLAAEELRGAAWKRATSPAAG